MHTSKTAPHWQRYATALLFTAAFGAMPGHAAAAGTLVTIHSFASDNVDGVNPATGLVSGPNSTLLGVTLFGGASGGGTVFSLTPKGAEKVVHSFGAAPDASGPTNPLMRASDGNYYGTTSNGGRFNAGTVYRVTPRGKVTVLYSFAGGTDPTLPLGKLTQGSDGFLYGTTYGGGAHGGGTVFRISTTGVETTLYSFDPNYSSGDGYNPNAGLVEAADGYLYGTTAFGGYGPSPIGTVFRVGKDGSEAVLHTFSGDFYDSSIDGAEPLTGLTRGKDGFFYGTTISGGSAALGTVFRISADGVETPIYSFASLHDAYAPGDGGDLIQASDGSFYGTTSNGGAYGQGTIYRITTDGTESLVHSFGSGEGDGYHPGGSLLERKPGVFFGTTYGDYSTNKGTVYKLTMTP